MSKMTIAKLTALSLTALVAGLLGACSTESPTAPAQNPEFPINSGVDAAFSCEQAPAGFRSGLTIVFINESRGVINFIRWDFGDGRKSSQVNPIHTYNRSGPFLVTLRVTGGGETSQVSQFVPTSCTGGDDGDGEDGDGEA